MMTLKTNLTAVNGNVFTDSKNAKTHDLTDSFDYLLKWRDDSTDVERRSRSWSTFLAYILVMLNNVGIFTNMQIRLKFSGKKTELPVLMMVDPANPGNLIPDLDANSVEQFDIEHIFAYPG